MLCTRGILAFEITLIPGDSRTTIALVHFLVQYFLPVFKYLFFAGLIGAIPVIIITAIRTAISMVEEDEPVRENKG
jgi:hypothetical protein